MRIAKEFNFLIFLFTVILTTNVWSCPFIGEVPDYNCDGKSRIAFTGDSFVQGYGDYIKNNQGGYVYRLQKLLPESRIPNIGLSGIRTHQLYDRFYDQLVKGNRGLVYQRTRNLDIIIIDVGRNDYWLKKPIAFTTRNIKRLVLLIKRELSAVGQEPIVVVGTMLKIKRSFQQPFIDAVNARLLAMRKSQELPVEIFFNRANADISFDGLHPSRRGYIQLSNFAKSWLVNRYPELAAEKRHDLDGDGVYDEFEDSVKYPTSSSSYDSDGDGVSDGQEIFITLTDPMDPLSF